MKFHFCTPESVTIKLISISVIYSHPQSFFLAKTNGKPYQVTMIAFLCFRLVNFIFHIPFVKIDNSVFRE